MELPSNSPSVLELLLLEPQEITDEQFTQIVAYYRAEWGLYQTQLQEREAGTRKNISLKPKTPRAKKVPLDVSEIDLGDLDF